MPLPTVWQRQDLIIERCAGRRLAVFLDYDGTLTPIVSDPADARLSDEMRRAIAKLAGGAAVAVVSGRDIGVLRNFVRLDGICYAGTHGLEISAPGGREFEHPRAREFVAELDRAERALHMALAPFTGSLVERKPFSLALHYRRVAPAEHNAFLGAVGAVAAGCAGLRRLDGKMVLELRPDIDWDKGRAVLWLLEAIGLDRPQTLPVYVGDDNTDEDAFRTLVGRGLTVVVRDTPDRASAADFALDGVADVRKFLTFLAELVRTQPPDTSTARASPPRSTPA